MTALNYIAFAFVLYAACGSVVFKLKRRKYFWLKLIGSSFIYFLIISLIVIFRWPLRIGRFNFIFIIADCICMLIIKLCFKTSLPCALFYATIGYTIENVSNRIFNLFKVAVTINFVWKAVVQLAIGFVVIAIIYLLFIRREHRNMHTGNILLPNTSTIVVSSITIIFIYVLSTYSDTLKGVSNAIFANVTTLGYGILLLMIQLGVFSRNRLEEEKSVVSRAMLEEREQYKLSKENIEKINIKCHDIKHQIDKLRSSDDKDRAEQIKELENLLKTYEAGIRTGNSALDAVLLKKALQCNELNINLLPMIDGGAAALLTDEDIYSLFGNILDNAIEYLAKVDEDSFREINLKITERNKLLIIHCENYCPTPLKFKGGLPVTTKPDADNHGFGMASIKYIVNKYKGTLSVKQEDDSFILNIIIPV